MQTNKVTERPFAQVAAAIQALDLESVKLRLMDPVLGEGWTREYADSIETAYKTYLTLVAKYQDDAEDILLAKDVDEFWHTHILQTMKYAADCQAAFGGFLHHEPHVGAITQELRDKRGKLADKTRALYEREFGSVQNAEAAWAGRLNAAAAAMSSVAIRADGAAMSSVAIRAGEAAMSSVAIRSEQAAMSSVAIRAEQAAMSSVAIRAEQAAMSSVAIRADDAAMSSVAIRADHAAMSSVAIDADRAAMSSVAFRAENAAMSSVALRSSDAPAAAAAV
jgi:hypothetical protein